MNRREFVLAGAAVAGAVSVARARSRTAAVDAPNAFYRVVFDTRFAASRALAAALPDSVAGSVAVAGDVTRLWFDDLAHRWAADDIVLAGMTTAATLFCLEQLAGDHWRRVVMRIEHRSVGAGGMEHRITSSAFDAAAAAGRFGASALWPEAAAASLASCRAQTRVPLVTRTLSRRSGAYTGRFANGLVSWVIA